MNLAGVDLNLLLVFDAVMSERNVTRAANRLGMTQPAVSNALNRLRLTVKDELFLRGPDGVRPTPRALELSMPVHESLQRLEHALDPVDFDPATTTRTFRIGMAEYFSALMLPKIVCRMRQEAPNAKLYTFPLTRLNVVERLEKGEVDIIVVPRRDMGETYRHQELLRDRFLVAMRKDHPLAGKPLTLEDFCSAEHVLITLTGDTLSPVDDALHRQNCTRRVVLTTNQFLVTFDIVSRTDLLLTCPGVIVRRYQDTYGLVLKELPVDVPLAPLQIIWHAGLGNHPAIDWFRALVAELCIDPCCA
ncbi:MAG TPA: LysR family transcriptional regulator [Azospirillum sp.]|nr:LysR family transcriptional regulator [Azospirillum sp.]